MSSATDRRPNRSVAAGRRTVHDELTTSRLAALGDRCRELERGLYNAEKDPAPLFAGLPYAAVMPVALRDPVVARVMRSLPVDWRWPDE